nr:alpha-amylase family glycosyl hydrolase [Iodidimonas nitroreducens]
MKSGAHEDWWKGAVMYQIYPRSFQDSSGNGVGDIQGIIDRLDYIASLGVDGIWLSPFFVSPMLDFGYDVADYRAVDPIFGTLDSFKKLVYEAHARGLKLIIDQIYSHTSDQHEWFKESRSSRINSKADWYVWADPKPDGSAPNNWQSFFGGPAWSWDSQRQQYYLHNFLSQQPDLDVRTPAVQEALLDVARFWLDLGIDGFRLDVANFYMCDPLLRDNPPAIYPQEPRPYRYQRHVHDKSHPDNLAFIARLRNLLDSYGARMIVAEIEDDDPIARTAEYTNGPERLHTAYNFVYLAAKGVPDAAMLSGPLKDWNERAGASWPSWAFSNHDVPRVISRWNSELSDQQRAKLYQALLLSLRGTIFIYQAKNWGCPRPMCLMIAFKIPRPFAFGLSL